MQCSKQCGSGEKSRKVFCMIGNKTVDVSQCKPEAVLYITDECNKQPCGEGKLLLYNNYYVYLHSTKVIPTFICFCIDQIIAVESTKPISEEDTSEEECEDVMITVTPFAIDPDIEVLFYFITSICCYILSQRKMLKLLQLFFYRYIFLMTHILVSKHCLSLNFIRGIKSMIFKHFVFIIFYNRLQHYPIHHHQTI